MTKKWFKHSLIFLLILAIFFPNSSFALRKFLPEYDDFRNKNGALVNLGYRAYKTEKLLEKQATEQFAPEGSVQVKTVFDFYDTKRAERINYVKNELLTQMKDRTIGPVGDDAIDTIINKLQSPGKYFIVRTQGDIIPIDANTIIFLYDYKLTGQEDLIELVKKQVQKLQSEEDSINLEQRNTELNNILKILDKFKIKYVRLGKYRDGTVSIGRGNGLKVSWTENFFINKLFTTPELNELIDTKDSKALYFWTYIPTSDLKTRYYSANEGLNNDVFIEFMGDTVFGGTIKADTKIYENTLFASSRDNFVYTIKENQYEYYILALSFLLGGVLWLYMTFNFIHGFRNNFKKTPEEL